MTKEPTATPTPVVAPERLIICTDGHRLIVADWAKTDRKPCDFEYVRADLASIGDARCEWTPAPKDDDEWLLGYYSVQCKPKDDEGMDEFHMLVDDGKFCPFCGKTITPATPEGKESK